MVKRAGKGDRVIRHNEHARRVPKTRINLGRSFVSSVPRTFIRDDRGCVSRLRETLTHLILRKLKNYREREERERESCRFTFNSYRIPDLREKVDLLGEMIVKVKLFFDKFLIS